MQGYFTMLLKLWWWRKLLFLVLLLLHSHIYGYQTSELPYFPLCLAYLRKYNFNIALFWVLKGVHLYEHQCIRKVNLLLFCNLLFLSFTLLPTILAWVGYYLSKRLGRKEESFSSTAHFPQDVFMISRSAHLLAVILGSRQKLKLSPQHIMHDVLIRTTAPKTKQKNTSPELLN